MSHIERDGWRIAAAVVVSGALLIALPSRSHAAAGADCSALMAAARKQSQTPFHATFVMTPMVAGAFEPETHQEIWVNKKMYTLLPGPRWVFARVPDDPMGGVNGPINGFMSCHPIPAASIRGETTTGYAVTLESRQKAQMWISPKTGLLVRDVVDQDPARVTFDFDYANVRAPAVK